MGKKRVFSVMMAVCMFFSVVFPEHIWGAVKTENEKAAEPSVLYATDYGADPSGSRDNAKAVQKVIAAAKEKEGPVIIEFPKGEYQIYPDKIEPRELYISNTVGANQEYKMKKIGFLFEDMENVTLRGNGSLFMFHGKMTTFATINSKNIKFEDFSFDFCTPTVVDVTVESVEGNTAVMYVPECYDYSVNGTTITWKSDVSPYTGQPYWTAQNAMNYKQVCDIKTGLTTRSGSGLFDHVVKIEELPEHRLKFTYASRPGDITSGKCYQMRPTVRDHAGMFFWKSDGITLKDINLHFLHGFGIVGQHSQDLTLDHVIFQAPEGSGRTTVGYADFIQMSGCKGKITVQDCSFSNPHDDPINIHGTFNEVVEKIASNKFKVRYMHGETAGFPNFFEGNEVEFVTKNNLIAVENSVARVVKVEGPTGQDGADQSGSGSLTDTIITLDRDLPQIAAGVHVVENITYTPEVLIQNNVFKETPTRGILVTTRKKVEIKNNVFDGMGMASIFISDDAQDWRESGAVQDVTIEGNTFLRPSPGYAAILIGPTNPTVSTASTVHKNIKVLNNDFYLQDGMALDAKSVDGISFQGNRVYRYDPGVNLDLAVSKTNLNIGEKAALQAKASGKSHASNLFSFNGCKEVQISGNLYDGGLKLGGSMANMQGSDITQNTDGVWIGTNAETSPAVGMVSYETARNDGVIQVSHTGEAIALKNGTAQVRAYTVTGGKKYVSDWKSITVSAQEEQDPLIVTAVPDKETAQEYGETIQYQAEAASAVTWAVKDAETGGETRHAAIDASSGKLTTVSDGAVEVAAEADGQEAGKLLVINKGGNVLSKAVSVENESNSGQENWQVTEQGAIRTKALAQGLWATQEARNIFSIPLDNAQEVSVTVKMTGRTAVDYEEAGLLLFKDTDNYVFIGRKHGGSNPSIRVMNEQNQNPSEDNLETVNPSEDSVYFKLEKAGDMIRAYYSVDGRNWTERGSGYRNAEVGTGLKVGVYAACGGGSDTFFEFSDLTVESGGKVQNIPLAFQNDKPAASHVVCRCEDGILRVDSQFSDPNEDGEGVSIVRWLASSQEDGTYRLVPGLYGTDIAAPAALAGKYVKAVVIPQDSNGLYGDPAESADAVRVNAAALPEAVSITGGKASTNVIGETIPFQASVTPSNAAGAITWSVADAATGGETSHAVINADGQLTTVFNGIVEVIATTVNGFQARKLLVINQENEALAPNLKLDNADYSKWGFVEGGAADGQIRIQAQPGGIWAGTNNAKNIISQALTESENVTVSVKMRNGNTSEWDEAGLLLFQDLDHYVAIARKSRENNRVEIRMTHERGGVGEEGAGSENVAGEDVYFKLEKTGDRVKGYFSPDGQEWKLRREVTGVTLGEGLKVGFYSASSHNTGFEFSELKINGATVPLSVKNTAPSAAGVICTEQDGKLHAELAEYTDPENDAPGTSVVRWTAASEENGDYRLIPGLYGNDIYVPASFAGMYVKAVMAPQDCNGLYGAPVAAAEAVSIDSAKTLPASESALRSARITGVGSFGAFDSGTRYYMTTAAKEQTKATVSVEAKDSRAALEITLNGKEIVKGEEGKPSVSNLTLPLVAGMNAVRVKVTAEDQKTQTTYGFAIFRAGDANANASGIQLNGTPLAGFSPDAMEYSYAAGNVSSIKVGAAAESPRASVTVAANGTVYKDNPVSVPLAKGLNDIVVTVKPETRAPEKRYHIVVAVPKKDNANLRKLEFSSGVVLEDAFETEVKTYQGTATLAEVSLTLQAEEEDAKLEILKGAASLGTGTGMLQKRVPMYCGMNELKVKVTSPDGSVTEIYDLHIRGVDKVMMSALQYDAASFSGWNGIHVNKSVEGNPITLWVDGKEKVFESGIGSHADMKLIYNIGGMGFVEFSAFMGVDREASDRGTVTLSIFLDDDPEPVWTSGSTEMTKNTEAAFVKIPVAGKNRIEIRADKGADNSNDHVSIGDGIFYTGLQEEPPFVDKTDLNGAIRTAETYEPEENYTAESWAALQAALGNAREAAANIQATQELVDQRTEELKAAVRNMKTREKEAAEQAVAADKEALQKPEIGSGDTFYLVTEGANGSKITWESSHEAIKIQGGTATVTKGSTAVTVVLTATVTSGTGDDMASGTVDFELVVPAEEPSPKVDKTSLNQVIKRAETYQKGNYTDSSWKALQAALAEARQASKDPGISQEAVDARQKALELAVKGLKKRLDLAKSATVKLKKDSYAYNGKPRQPAVVVQAGKAKLALKKDYTVSYKKNVKVGKAYVTVTGVGKYMGKVTKTFRILPRGTSIKGKPKARPRGFTIKWKKEAVSGYEVQYSVSNKFKKSQTKTKVIKKPSVTSLTVGKLKAGRKYYIRIRTYKKAGTVYRSGWSKVQTVKTKK